MSTENWDDDFDSTQAIMSPEDYARCAAPPKTYNNYDNQQSSGRGSNQKRSNDNSRFDGRRDREGRDNDWRKPSGRSGQDRQEGGDGRRYNDRSSDDSMQIKIDSNKVGMVIGRGGSKIKEIQDMFGVNVKVGK